MLRGLQGPRPQDQKNRPCPRRPGALHLRPFKSLSYMLSTGLSALQSCIQNSCTWSSANTSTWTSLALQGSYIQNLCLLAQTFCPDWSKGSSIPLAGHPTNPGSASFYTPHPTKLTGSTFQKCLDPAVFSPSTLC